MRSEFPCTPESIRAAKYAARLERMDIFAKTGVLITDDGRIVLPSRAAQLIECPELADSVLDSGANRFDALGLGLGGMMVACLGGYRDVGTRDRRKVSG